MDYALQKNIPSAAGRAPSVGAQTLAVAADGVATLGVRYVFTYERISIGIPLQ